MAYPSAMVKGEAYPGPAARAASVRYFSACSPHSDSKFRAAASSLRQNGLRCSRLAPRKSVARVKRAPDPEPHEPLFLFSHAEVGRRIIRMLLQSILE